MLPLKKTNQKQKWHPTIKYVHKYRSETPHRRQRALKAGESPYRALLETMELTNTKLTLQLINDKNKVGQKKKLKRSSLLFPALIFCSLAHFRSSVLVRQVRLLLELYRLQGNMTRVKINELKPLKPRFEVPDVLIKEPSTEP